LRLVFARVGVIDNQLSVQEEERAQVEKVLESSGPWPFTSHAWLLRSDNSHVLWLSRTHRKRLITTGRSAAQARILQTLWLPKELNWWIGVLFALGASLFLLACLLFLLPSIQAWFKFSDMETNTVFFVGSIFFTTAAYLQLFQAANSPPIDPMEKKKPMRRYYIGWRPNEIGWLSCALQFSGTVLFNINTFDAILPSLNWRQQELEIWLPNIVGSMLFLASGYLAFVETCHKHLAWKPADLSWWITLINLLGCIGFMIAAVYSLVLPGAPNETWLTMSLVFTLQGAVCFFVGSLLMLPEIVVASKMVQRSR
jgi:heme/copper-type cytochrome/quinol oxidase subunit 4